MFPKLSYTSNQCSHLCHSQALLTMCSPITCGAHFVGTFQMYLLIFTTVFQQKHISITLQMCAINIPKMFPVDPIPDIFRIYPKCFQLIPCHTHLGCI